MNNKTQEAFHAVIDTLLLKIESVEKELTELRAFKAAIEAQEPASTEDESSEWSVTSGMNTTIDYQLALAIVEGKPVFEGENLYCHNGVPYTAKDGEQEHFYASLSWNPPKPKTVTVELSRDDAERIASIAYMPETLWFRIAKSFKEALK